MLYRILSRFGPEDGAKWQEYLQWRGLRLDRFDSIDSILRPSLFNPETVLDWDNCVQADYRLDLITSLDYATSILGRYKNVVIVGVQPDVDSVRKTVGLSGYDVIDAFSGISLLTNWGVDEEMIMTPHIASNGLVMEIERALAIRDELRQRFPEDDHANQCTVWGVYRVPEAKHQSGGK
jgi:hypothetical protein